MTPRIERLARIVLPILVGLIVLALWEVVVAAYAVPAYILPGPIAIAAAFIADGANLVGPLRVTLEITFAALAGAIVLGGALGIVLAQSRWVEFSLFPYAVILQVTPIVAIAPLIIIWVDNAFLAATICAWIVAFFPIVSSTTLGIRSADRNLADLFRLYRAGRWQTLRYLQIPAALPYFFGGLRISGGLALIGAVVAEFVAGTGGTETGLAFRILEAGFRLQVPRLFAALALLSLAGIVIFVVLGRIGDAVLRNWHESALPRED